MPGFTGTKTASNTALAETKSALVGAIGGGILIWDVFVSNPDATNVSFVQFFDATSANVTVGSTTPTFVVAVSPKGTSNIAFANPRQFNNAVTVACTATATGSGAPGTANVLSIGYTPA